MRALAPSGKWTCLCACANTFEIHRTEAARSAKKERTIFIEEFSILGRSLNDYTSRRAIVSGRRASARTNKISLVHWISI